MCPRCVPAFFQPTGEHTCTTPRVAFQIRIQNVLRRAPEDIVRSTLTYERWSLSLPIDR